MSVKFLYLQNSVGQAPMGALKQLQGYEIHMVQQYETDRLDWGDYHIVMISMFADQIHLDEMRAKISAYLDGGGTLIINGHIARPFCPNLAVINQCQNAGLPSWQSTARLITLPLVKWTLQGCINAKAWPGFMAVAVTLHLTGPRFCIRLAPLIWPWTGFMIAPKAGGFSCIRGLNYGCS